MSSSQGRAGTLGFVESHGLWSDEVVLALIP